MKEWIDQATHLLDSVRGKTLTDGDRQDKAIELTGYLLKLTQIEETTAEKQQQAILVGLMDDPQGKLFVTELTDQCFRTHNAARTADQIRYLIDKWGIPRSFPMSSSLELKGFTLLSGMFPSFAVRMAQQAIRKQMAGVVVPGEKTELNEYLEKRYAEGFRVNLNHLGEAILGEEEAERRLTAYLNDLSNQHVECISVKISTIFSQIQMIAWDQTLEQLSKRLKKLYRRACESQFTLKDGRKINKFVYLDMEEFRDLHLTVEAFKKALEDPEFTKYSAGIVLQAYIPDSFTMLQQLTEWAVGRKNMGGAPIKVRIVKGANLAMEKVEASLKGWPQAPYCSKWEADANFKKMLLWASEKENSAAVHVGIGSHNLFDIAYALLLRTERILDNTWSFEMLEGMVPYMSRAVKLITHDLLLYSPTATDEEFHTAVAYLMRRLDENTAPKNFLRSLFSLQENTPAWSEQVDAFKKSCQGIGSLNTATRRIQDRSQENLQPTRPEDIFQNTPDTDWSLAVNRQWIYTHLERWKTRQSLIIPLCIQDKEIITLVQGQGEDPSRPDYPLYAYQLADKEHVDAAVDTAKHGWNASLKERADLLGLAALELGRSRGDLIAAMVADAGKTVYEADIEVSEAIDFCEYYRRNAIEWSYLHDIQWRPLGAVAVAPPWNFPCSIPAGGIAAALAAGNSVIFKPARETILTAWVLVEAFWRAGIPRTVLQFLTCDDSTVGTSLVRHPDLAALILTGATATAQTMLKLNPKLRLFAETGGKNSMIVTEMSDKDQAIKDVLQSAFGHAGQKCSACSLLILLPEVYDDQHFKNQLSDAAASMTVSSAWDLSTKIPPLIRPAEGALLQGLTQLENEEEWLLAPRQSTVNPNLWSPGIKWGVTEHSFSYSHELFGPVLSVMKADSLEHALSLANGTSYGLTAGIHTLDRREIDFWLERIVAGNLYINRTITGAIVQRQPFGGTKMSSYGPGSKAGGPNYCIQLMQPHQIEYPQLLDPIPEKLFAINNYVDGLELSHEQKMRWNAGIGSFSYFQNRYFNFDHDPVELVGQDNFLRYVPRMHATIRVQDQDDLLDILLACAAAITAGCPLEISAPNHIMSVPPIGGLWHYQNPHLHFIEEEDPRLAQRAAEVGIQSVRFFKTPPLNVSAALAQAGCAAIISPLVLNGRIELLHYLREVSISDDYHRYGNIGAREFEQKTSSECCGGGACCK